MKKLAWFVAALMVSAMALPAVAADAELSGSLENSVVWRQQQWKDSKGNLDPEKPAGVSALSTLTLDARLGMPGVRAYLEVSPLKQTFDPQSRFSLGEMTIDKAYLEATGELWQGSPQTITRLGTLDVAFSPYVATFQREGLAITGLQYGPVMVGAFVGRDADVTKEDAQGNPIEWGNPFTVAGAQVRGEMMGVGASATVLQIAGRPAWELGASAIPVPGIAVNAVYGVDGEHAQPGVPAPRMMRFETAAQVVPDLTLSAGYRMVDAGFGPRYVKIEKDADDQRIDWVYENRGQTGMTLGLRTIQQGVTIEAGLDNYTARWDPEQEHVIQPAQHRDATLAASTDIQEYQVAASSEFDLMGGFTRKESKLSVARTFAMQGVTVTPKYQATIDASSAVEHELSAAGTINLVPQFPGLGVEAKATLKPTGQVTLGGGLTYTAPNGLAVGIHHDPDKGSWADASLKVAF